MSDLVDFAEHNTGGPVDLVSFGPPFGTYNLSTVGETAVTEFLNLGQSVSDEAILHFASSYGPLMSMTRWAYEALVTSEWPFKLRSSPDPVAMTDLVDLNFYNSTQLLTADKHYNSFWGWCQKSPDPKTKDVVEQLFNMQIQIQLGKRLHYDEPVAFYRWASVRSLALSNELSFDELSDESHSWLSWQFSYLRQVPARDGKSLTLEPTSLLSRLTLQIWRKAHRDLDRFRKCLECGKTFDVSIEHKKYCSNTCMERRKKSNWRKKRSLKVSKMEGGKSDGQTW